MTVKRRCRAMSESIISVAVPNDHHSGMSLADMTFGIVERSFETQKPRQISGYEDKAVDADMFLAFFPEFSTENGYSIKMIEAMGKRVRFFVTYQQCDNLDGEDRNYARSLLMAHMLVLYKKQQDSMNGSGNGGSGASGGTSVGQMGGSGILQSASVGGVSVSMQIPQSQSAWEFWLNQTPYGIEYQAYMSSHVPVGLYCEGDDLRGCLRD